MLLLADRGFFSYALWRKAIATGADLLWRIRTDRAGPQPQLLEDLADGSWLAHLRRSTGAAERAVPPMLVRVIDYTIDDGRDHPASYRLFTTMLDPAEAPGGRAGRRLRPTVGDRAGLRRAEDPPARTPHRAALEVPGPGAAGDLGTPVLPLRDPLPDGRGRRARRPRPRPGQLRRRAADRPGQPSPTRAHFPP